jgi:hypothetical protein
MGGGTLVWKNNMNKNRISIFFAIFAAIISVRRKEKP